MHSPLLCQCRPPQDSGITVLPPEQVTSQDTCRAVKNIQSVLPGTTSFQENLAAQKNVQIHPMAFIYHHKLHTFGLCAMISSMEPYCRTKLNPFAGPTPETVLFKQQSTLLAYNTTFHRVTIITSQKYAQVNELYRKVVWSESYV